MQNKTEKKLFAFKLAEKTQQVQSDAKWQAKDGVASASCSGPWARARTYRDYAYNTKSDSGMYC